MQMTDYWTLGCSGLIVSSLTPGTMTFCAGRWGSDLAEARRIFEAYVAAAGNVVDTADVYRSGESERMLGGFLKESGLRDRIVVSTKSSFARTGESAAWRQPRDQHPAGGRGFAAPARDKPDRSLLDACLGPHHPARRGAAARWRRQSRGARSYITVSRAPRPGMSPRWPIGHPWIARRSGSGRAASGWAVSALILRIRDPHDPDASVPVLSVWQGEHPGILGDTSA